MNPHRVALLLLLIVLLSAGLGWTVLQWIECREMRHSILYCVAHVT